MPGEQDDGLTMRRNLDRAGDDALRENVSSWRIGREGQRGTCESHPHAVRLRRHRIGGGEEGRQRRIGETILLRAEHHTHRNLVGIARDDLAGQREQRRLSRCRRTRLYWNLVASPQRAPLDAADVPHEIRRAAAERRRNGYPALNREICSCSLLAGAKPQGVARLEAEAAPG